MGVTWLACRMEKRSWCGRFQARSLKILKMLSRRLTAHVFALSYMHLYMVKIVYRMGQTFFFYPFTSHHNANKSSDDVFGSMWPPWSLQFCPAAMQWNAERLTTQMNKGHLHHHPSGCNLWCSDLSQNLDGLAFFQTKKLDRKLCSC